MRRRRQVSGPTGTQVERCDAGQAPPHGPVRQRAERLQPEGAFLWSFLIDDMARTAVGRATSTRFSTSWPPSVCLLSSVRAGRVGEEPWCRFAISDQKEV